MAQAGGLLYVGSQSAATPIGAYDLATGVAVPGFTPIAGVAAYGLAVTGNTLYVAVENGSVIRTYNATTGALINDALVTGAANSFPASLAIAGNVLYVTFNDSGKVNAYDASTGATLAGFVPISVAIPFGVAVLGNTLYVSDNAAGGNVGAYNATTGAVINASFITGAGTFVEGLGVFNNTLYVASDTAHGVGSYDATTGAAINSTFITGLNSPFQLVIAIPPAPTVMGVSPASGPVAGGTGVTITRTGFTRPTTVGSTTQGRVSRSIVRRRSPSTRPPTQPAQWTWW